MVRKEGSDAGENRPQGEVLLGTIAAPGPAGDVTTRVVRRVPGDHCRPPGAALESDEEVREATYSVAPSEAGADEQKRHRRPRAAV